MTYHKFQVHNIRADNSTTDESNEKLKQLEFVQHHFNIAKTFEENGIPHYECPLCKKVLMRQQGLRIHLRGVHLNLKSYECKTCHKKFVSPTTLKYHLKFVHSKKNNPNERSKHLEIIREITAKATKFEKNGRVMYECPLCKKVLMRQQGLRLHYMSNHI